jgi:hypothetical protein
MLRDPVDGAFVLCVGLPIQLVGDLARLLRDHAVVLATGDTDGARALLGPPAEAAHLPRQRSPDPPPGGRHDSGRLDGSWADGVRHDVGPLDVGPLRIDRAAREVSVGSATVHMSAREFDLLLALGTDLGRVWSFEELTEEVWGHGYLGDTEQVASTVKRLRKRIAAVPGVAVVSVRGIGYRLTVSDQLSGPVGVA